MELYTYALFACIGSSIYCPVDNKWSFFIALPQ